MTSCSATPSLCNPFGGPCRQCVQEVWIVYVPMITTQTPRFCLGTVITVATVITRGQANSDH